MEQPEGFELSDNPDLVCKLKKDLYGLKQAPRAWYHRLDTYLKDKGFKRGIVDNNLYIKTEDDDFLIVLVYVDDFIFGCNKDSLVQWFSSAMESEFEMSMIGELSFFLGLQITQRSKGNSRKRSTSHPDIMHAVGIVGRYQSAPKQSHLLAVKRIFRYLKETMNYGLWYPKNHNFQLSVYSDDDWAKYMDERKITSRGAFFLGDSLVAWLSKK
jgi:hypothetical protein